jgi:hypothetical protein
MSYQENYCLECGEPIGIRYTYCIKCAYDTCKCGSSKKRHYDLCRECNQKEQDAEIRAKYGSERCPFCGEEFLFSEYLQNAIPNPKTRLIANLITHYRHNHQASWNKSCHYISQKWGEDAYQEAKNKHNNRAKRQILRKCKKWIIESKITEVNFKELQYNDNKTCELINKVFEKDLDIL